MASVTYLMQLICIVFVLKILSFYINLYIVIIWKKNNRNIKNKIYLVLYNKIHNNINI